MAVYRCSLFDRFVPGPFHPALNRFKPIVQSACS